MVTVLRWPTCVKEQSERHHSQRAVVYKQKRHPVMSRWQQGQGWEEKRATFYWQYGFFCRAMAAAVQKCPKSNWLTTACYFCCMLFIPVGLNWRCVNKISGGGKTAGKSAVNTLQVPAPPAQRTPATTRECACSCGRASHVTAPWPPTGGLSAVTVSAAVLYLTGKSLIEMLLIRS